ncbi:MAG: hypothetical protein WA744_02470, partial [Candidatus Acidiferrales bacterium]
GHRTHPFISCQVAIRAEEQLPKCLAAMMRIAVKERAERDKREEEEQARQKRIDEVRAQLRQIEKEEQRIKTLEREAIRGERAKVLEWVESAERRRLGKLRRSPVNVTVIRWSPAVVVCGSSNMSCPAGRAAPAREHLQDEAVCCDKRRSALRCRELACIDAHRQIAFPCRNGHTAPLPQ